MVCKNQSSVSRPSQESKTILLCFKSECEEVSARAVKNTILYFETEP